MSDKKFDRRNFFKIVGAAGVATGAGALLPKSVPLAKADKKGKGRPKHEVKPGDLDDYYGERALRGSLLPKGWRKVTRLDIVE